MKEDIGKYFYDPYDGKIKRLVEKNGVLGFLEFNSVEEIDLTAVEEGVSTVSSTPYADEQAAMEQEKGRGYLTDEDIFSKRYPSSFQNYQGRGLVPPSLVLLEHTGI